MEKILNLQNYLSQLFLQLKLNLKSEERNEQGLAKFILEKKINSKPNPKSTCIYCGNIGATEIPGYIFPFITTIQKYPNAYPLGTARSKAPFNFCPECMLISFAAQSRLLFQANNARKNNDFISSIMFFSTNEHSLKKIYSGFISPSNIIPNYYSNLKNLLQPIENDTNTKKTFL